MIEWSAFTQVMGEPAASDAGRDDLVATLADLWHRSIYGRVPEDGPETHDEPGGEPAGDGGAGGDGQNRPSA
jgi:hypothetical protein